MFKKIILFSFMAVFGSFYCSDQGDQDPMDFLSHNEKKLMRWVLGTHKKSLVLDLMRDPDKKKSNYCRIESNRCNKS